MDIISETIESINKQGLNVKNLVIYKHGDIIAEYHFEKIEPSLLWSVSKSITSLAIGIAIDQGYFSLDDKLTDYFPNEVLGKDINDPIFNVTIHDLLCMCVGHDKCPIERALENNMEIKDIKAMFFNEPITHEVGKVFRYNNTAGYILSYLITITTGETLLEFCYRNLFEPIGISKPRWDSDEKGITLGFSGLYLNVYDLAKIGVLVLNKGIYKDIEIVPYEYLKKATSIQISTSNFHPHFATADHKSGYGYQFWMNQYQDSYRMDGLYGQYVVILPKEDAVVTYISNEPKKMINILELTWNTLINKL